MAAKDSGIEGSVLKATYWLSRVGIGVTFIASGWLKIFSAKAFSHALALFTAVFELRILILFVLPVLEIVLGVMILIGLYSRFSITTSIIVLIGFITYILLNIGNPLVNCGCFGDMLDLGYTYYGVAKNVLLILGLIYMALYQDQSNENSQSSLEES